MATSSTQQDPSPPGVVDHVTNDSSVSIPKGPDDSSTSKISTSLVSTTNDLLTDHFPQGVQFSPDGLCLLTSAGHRLVLYNTPPTTTTTTAQTEWKQALQCEAGDTIRSYAWYPHMNSADPSTCCFLGTSRDQPIHLWDAYSGSIRATYSPINQLDELESPTVVQFLHNGQRLVSGGFRTDRMLQLFDVNRPGKVPYQVLKLGKTRRSRDGQKGLVSCIATTSSTSSNHLMAVGTYAPGSIYLYDDRCHGYEEQASILLTGGTCIVGHGRSFGRKAKRYHQILDDNLNFKKAKIQWYQDRARPGVTQLEFGDGDDNYYQLFSTSRRSNAVLQWDLRKLTSGSGATCGVASFATVNETNQRLEFHIDSSKNHLWVGGQDCKVRAYSIATQKLLSTLELQEVANGVSLNKDGDKLAVVSGSRRFPSDAELDPDNDDDTFMISDQDNGGHLQIYSVSV